MVGRKRQRLQVVLQCHVGCYNDDRAVLCGFRIDVQSVMVSCR